MRLVLAFCLMAATAIDVANAGCRGGVVYLRISNEGTVSWNGVPFKTRQDMIDRFKKTAEQKQQPEIHIEPTPGTNYKAVQSVLIAMQNAGLHCLGFTGVDQGQ